MVQLFNAYIRNKQQCSHCCTCGHKCIRGMLCPGPCYCHNPFCFVQRTVIPQPDGYTSFPQLIQIASDIFHIEHDELSRVLIGPYLSHTSSPLRTSSPSFSPPPLFCPPGLPPGLTLNPWTSSQLVCLRVSLKIFAPRAQEPAPRVPEQTTQEQPGVILSIHGSCSFVMIS